MWAAAIPSRHFAETVRGTHQSTASWRHFGMPFSNYGTSDVPCKCPIPHSLCRMVKNVMQLPPASIRCTLRGGLDHLDEYQIIKIAFLESKGQMKAWLIHPKR
jgi:hypothetical protein